MQKAMLGYWLKAPSCNKLTPNITQKGPAQSLDSFLNTSCYTSFSLHHVAVSLLLSC